MSQEPEDELPKAGPSLQIVFPVTEENSSPRSETSLSEQPDKTKAPKPKRRKKRRSGA